jgi:hypothetical protein
MKPLLLLFTALITAVSPVSAEDARIRHSFLTLGRKTAIIGEDGSVLWEYNGGTRDGFVLPNGNILLAWKNRVEEVSRDKKVVFSYDLSAENKEIGTTQRLANGNTVIGSHGARTGTFLVEVTPDKQIVWTSEHPLATAVHHFQILTTNGQPEPGMPLK